MTNKPITNLTTPVTNNKKPNSGENNNNNNNNNNNKSMNQQQPFMNQPQPVMNQPQPVMNQPQPVMNQPKNNKGVVTTGLNNGMTNTKNKNKNKNKNEEKIEKNSNEKGSNKKNNLVPEEESSTFGTITKVIIMIIILALLFFIAKYLLAKYAFGAANTPYLLTGSKNAKYALVISQDINNVNYIPINKSDGQDGIQFTYGFWFLIDSFDYKIGEWKHMFHKGNSSSYPNRAPGAWIHPTKNAIRVYMNTLDNILEHADLENVPIRKWIYMNIVLNNKNLDLYINGYLKTRKELTSLPKQNDDDFWVNMFGGFEGYISNIRYYTYAIDFNEMNAMIKEGPSANNCINTGDVPPYLDDNWWFDYNI